jgi:hypothetical protein
MAPVSHTVNLVLAATAVALVLKIKGKNKRENGLIFYYTIN